MRRRFLQNIPETSSNITSKAYVYYPLNGNLKDYSGNQRDIVSWSDITIYDTYIKVSGYCQLPFYLESSINTAVSISFYYEGKLSNKRVLLWGRVGDYTNNWPVYSNMVRLSKNTDRHYATVTTDGETIDLPNGVFNVGKINNITITKTKEFVKIYINGSLHTTVPYARDTSSFGSSYIPLLGDINNLTDTVGDAYIHGFAYYKIALDEKEAVELSQILGYE